MTASTRSPLAPRPPRHRRCPSGAVSGLVGVSLALSLVGCEPDPAATDLDDWYYGLSGVLVENTGLARDIQDFAAEITKARKAGKVSAKKTAGRLEKKILPTARTVAEHAGAVRPQTAELQAMHDELATIWTDRADTYEAIVAAWESEDAEAVESGLSTVRDLRIAESFWFPRTNAVLEPKGYQFQEFPQSVPARPAP